MGIVGICGESQCVQVHNEHHSAGVPLPDHVKLGAGGHAGFPVFVSLSLCCNSLIILDIGCV